MATTTTETLQNEMKPLTSREQLDEFHDWFSRCRNTLHFTACLILGSSEMAEYAVMNCRFSAIRKLRSFKSEGAFGSWLLRVLISEALSIRRKCHTERFAGKGP